MISRLIRWFGLKLETEDTEPSSRITALGNQIGYDIPKEYQALFKRALRHRSIVDHETYQSHETYERLEFLGDAVLDLIITVILFDKYPRKDEGFLTKLRAKIIRVHTLLEHVIIQECVSLQEVWSQEYDTGNVL